jgi:hypothetical protein
LDLVSQLLVRPCYLITLFGFSQPGVPASQLLFHTDNRNRQISWRMRGNMLTNRGVSLLKE